MTENSNPIMNSNKSFNMRALTIYVLGVVSSVVGIIIFLLETNFLDLIEGNILFTIPLGLAIIGFVLALIGVVFGILGARNLEKHAVPVILFGLIILFVILMFAIPITLAPFVLH